MADTPIHLVGNNAPVAVETSISQIEVVGTIPFELSGTYVRNGPNPRTGWSPHLFAGDGMVHGIALADGAARWYRNRYVRTPLYEHPGTDRFALAFDPDNGRVDHRVSTANTHIVAHAGRLLALEEGGFPYELRADLDTVGPFTFDGALRTAMTAHPKRCPITGELLFFGYSLIAPYLTYHRAAADGRLLESRDIDVPRPTMMHDFAITETKVIFFDSPIAFDRAHAASGRPPWRWDDEHGARFGVTARSGGDTSVRWFDVEPGHVSHTMNAFDDGPSVVVTGCRIGSMWRAGPSDMSGDLPQLHEWTLDLQLGTATERKLDDTTTDYPRVPDAEVGVRNRFGYSTDFVMAAEPHHGEIYRFDLADDASRAVHRFPAGHTCGEPVFVPGEHGTDYLMTFAHDRARGTSYLAILDAADLDAEPIAALHVAARIPAGFHGSWIPA